MSVVDERLPCGCWIGEGLGGAWVIRAISFLCDDGHKQDDLVRCEWNGTRWVPIVPAAVSVSPSTGDET